VVVFGVHPRFKASIRKEFENKCLEVQVGTRTDDFNKISVTNHAQSMIFNIETPSTFKFKTFLATSNPSSKYP